ncbi:hypothetical protein COSHB9_01780 [Companilactobacillus alimentarius]|uniref:flavodoxin family protein n=1 Tax=Companilactobacillus alimentarius TaxID=1602 RepID=UPI0028BB9E3A|nr:hypothetical protein [Companilactobacillus alimentarius]MDT6951411.1 hypothetical protein [Companilactobacillus alimentarius]
MGKTLLVYYSLTGLNETIAQRIHEKYSIDLFNIHTTIDYPKSMYPCWGVVRSWRGVGSIPNHGEPLPNMDDLPTGIKNELPNLSSYDNIIIGGPVWGWTLSDPIMAYLTQADLSGKNIKAYWTCVDTDYNYENDLKEMLPEKSNYLAGLKIDSSIYGSKRRLDKVLDKLIKELVSYDVE